MNNAARAERIRSLVEVAIGILRRTQHCNLTLTDGSRVRAWDFCHNELSLSFRRRVDTDDRPTTLVVKYDGEKVLIASWTADGFTRRSYRPGEWEAALRRCGRMPALARD
ncbi:hypothetical protein MA20_40960 [Bradyrhizobium japonicum]|uniref:Uncharacterized protein n=1 Tax=Bradyrhizobium japonicum TaxID=375 RepID=A0A0A3XHV9_BRAJP|nr:hypothetical protein [Bradyrhizobium japonicum]KGT73890.1 hypothetical protein MA20_40960 [Bradyrhizobium japonicum]